MYDNASKAQLRARVKGHFSDLKNMLNEIVKAKNAYRNELEVWDSTDAVETYTISERENRKFQVRGHHSGKNAEVTSGLRAKLEELNKDLAALHGELDLEDPRLINALNIIKNGGATTFESTAALIEPFKYDQQALRILMGAYEGQEGEGAGLIAKRLYDPAAAMKRILSLAYGVSANPDSSVNELAREIGQIARIEGEEFDTTPDRAGMSFSDAIREKIGY